MMRSPGRPGRVCPVAGMLGTVPRLAAVDAAFCSLPDRYLGADPGFDATYQIRLCDIGRTWEVRCTEHGARVRKGGSRRQPDVTITTDSDTWMKLREGEFSGVDAFGRRLLGVRGNLDYAVGFEGMFRLPNGRPPLSKPVVGSYNAAWFAEIMLDLMDRLEVPRAHIVGNSLGGRIAIEVGLVAPERTGALGLLCPAVAWLRHSLHPLVRLLRPELGFLPHGFRRSLVALQFWSMFYDRDLIDPAVADLVVDEFRQGLAAGDRHPDSRAA